MKASRHKNVPEDVYPLDEWRLVEKRFDLQYLGAAESLFAISNGYLGMRGTCDEGQPGVHTIESSKTRVKISGSLPGLKVIPF